MRAYDYWIARLKLSTASYSTTITRIHWLDQFLPSFCPTLCRHLATTKCLVVYSVPISVISVDRWGNLCLRREQRSTCQCHPPVSSQTTCIAADASDAAVGAVLQQLIDRIWCPISFFFKKLKPSETRYSTFDRELLAVYLAIKHFRHFIEGREFHVHMDHKLLTFVHSTLVLITIHRDKSAN